MRFLKKNLIWVTSVAIIILVLLILSIKFYLNGQVRKKEEVSFDEQEDIIKEEEKEEILIIEKVFVDIKGAVVNPGVYEVEENKKVIDVINLAGGFTENANTTLINLAKQVKNEMVIIIYTNEEVENSKEEQTVVKVIEQECVCPKISNDACLYQENESNITTETGKINLNTASKEELETLPGIGSSKATAIIDYRLNNGEFKSIEDLKNVNGIGESLFEKVRDYITV